MSQDWAGQEATRILARGYITVDKIAEALREAEARGAEQGNHAMRQLEILTPGGSKFVGNPHVCRRYIQARLEQSRAEGAAAEREALIQMFEKGNGIVIGISRIIAMIRARGNVTPEVKA